MSKRAKRLLSLLLTLVMVMSLGTPAFALGGGSEIGIGGGFGRDIGDNEVRDFDPSNLIEDAEEPVDLFQGLDTERGIQVTVESRNNALPTMAEVRVTPVEAESVREAVEAAVEGQPNILVAMDISFWLDGIEIEPEEPVNVKISAPEFTGRTDLQVVHIPDAEDAQAETVELVDESELSFALGTNEIAFKADSFSVYVIIGGDDPDQIITPRVTYYFLNELENGTADPYLFANKSGDYVDYQIVKADSNGTWEKLQDPGKPVVSLEKNFLGWFLLSKSGDTYSYTDTSIVFDDQGEADPPVKTDVATGDKEVYVAPRYGQAFIVTFWDKEPANATDDDPMHIVSKRVVYLTEGESATSVKVDDLSVPSKATEVLSGWTSDNYIEGETTTKTLIDAPTWDEVTKSFDLYPIFSEGHWLRFSGGPSGSGAGYNPAIFVTANTQASELQNLGTVSREGYTFAGWYYDGFEGTEAASNASGAALNAADLLQRVQDADGDTVLYGHWTGNPVTYKVATWFENADDDNYSYGELTEYTGPAGTITNVTVSSVDGFTVQTIEQQTIKGDGTTIVNVYYKRNIYEVKFYNRNGRTEYTDLKITAKFGADIHDQWPGLKEGTQNYSTAWYSSTSSNSTWILNLPTMPLNGASYYQYSGSGSRLHQNFNVQSVSGGNSFDVLYETLYNGSTSIGTTPDDYVHIEGFSVNAASADDARRIKNDPVGDDDAVSNNAYNRSIAIGTSYSQGVRTGSYGNYTYTLNYYYLRNQYSVSFNTLKSGAANPAAMTGIYYEANIATSKATQIAALNQQYVPGETTVTVTGEGTYIFQGWYDNADGMGEPFNFDQKMPAGNITLYAKWDRIWYLIQIDPNGGEILPDVNEVTYTWVRYNEKIERYNIRRDYVEAEAGYSGTKYYYYELLASEDEHRHDDSGYYYSGYRKGFYISEAQLASKDAFMAAFPVFDTEYADSNWEMIQAHVDTSVVYKPAATNDQYSFVGWYKAEVNPTDDTLTYTNEVYDFDELVTKDSAIYAKWRRAGLFSVQYHTENGTVSGFVNNSLVETDESYADQANTKVAYTPDRITSTDGKTYVFVGWKLASPNGFDSTDPGSASFVGDVIEQGDDFTVNAAYADAGHFIHLVAFYELAESNPDTLPVTSITFHSNYPAEASAGENMVVTTEGLPLNTKIDLSQSSFAYTVIENDAETEKEGVIPSFTCTGFSMIGWNHDQAKATAGEVEIKLNDIVGVDNANPKDNTLYAVWAPAFFVYHTGTNTVERILLTPDANSTNASGAATFDLTKLVDKNEYLYGGYYKSYAGIGTKMQSGNALDTAALTWSAVTDAAAILPEGETYDALSNLVAAGKVSKATDTGAIRYTGQADAFTLADAYQAANNDAPGNAITPQAGAVYYIKEVPANLFLQPRLRYTYRAGTGDIGMAFMFTNLDDANYLDGGFMKGGVIPTVDSSIDAEFAKPHRETSYTVTAKTTELQHTYDSADLGFQGTYFYVQTVYNKQNLYKDKP